MTQHAAELLFARLQLYNLLLISEECLLLAALHIKLEQLEKIKIKIENITFVALGLRVTIMDVALTGKTFKRK